MKGHWRSLMIGLLGALQLIVKCQGVNKTARLSPHNLTPRDDKHQHHLHQRPVKQQPHAVKRGLVDTQRLQFSSNKGNPTVALKRAMEGKLSSKLVSYYESFPFFWDSDHRRYAPRFTPHLTFYKDWSRKGVTKNNVPPRAEFSKAPERDSTVVPSGVALTNTNSATERNAVQSKVNGLKDNGRNGLVHPQGAYNQLLGKALPVPGPAQTGALQVSVNHVANKGPVNSGPSQLATYQAPVGTQARGEKSSGTSVPLIPVQNRNMLQGNTNNALEAATHSDAPSRASVKSLPSPVNTEKPKTALPQGNTNNAIRKSTQNTTPSKVITGAVATNGGIPQGYNAGNRQDYKTALPQGNAVGKSIQNTVRPKVITGAAATNGGIPQGYNAGNRQDYKTALPVRAPLNSGPPRAKIEPPPVPLLQSKPQPGENFRAAPEDATKSRDIEAAKPSGGLGPALAAASIMQTSGNPAITRVVSDRGSTRGIQGQVLNSPFYDQKKQTPAVQPVAVARESAPPPRGYHAPPLVAAYRPNGRFPGSQAVGRGTVSSLPSSRAPPPFNQQRANIYPGSVNRLNIHSSGNVHFPGRDNFQGNVARAPGNLNHLPNNGLLAKNGAQMRSDGRFQGPRASFPGSVVPQNKISTGILGRRPFLSSTSSNGFRGSNLPISTNPQQTVGSISKANIWSNSQKRTNGMGIERSVSQRASVPYKSSYPIFLYKHSPSFQVKRNLKRTVESTRKNDAKARRRLLELWRK